VITGVPVPVPATMVPFHIPPRSDGRKGLTALVHLSAERKHWLRHILGCFTADYGSGWAKEWTKVSRCRPLRGHAFGECLTGAWTRALF